MKRKPVDEDNESDHQSYDEESVAFHGESMIITPEVEHLEFNYGILPPIESTITLEAGRRAYNLKHHRVHLEFFQNTPGKTMNKTQCNIFGRSFYKDDNKKTINIVAIGLSSFAVDGTTSVGLQIRFGASETQDQGSVLNSVHMAESGKYAFTLMHKCHVFECNKLLFQPRRTNSIQKSFPTWTKDDVDTGVIKNEPLNKDSSGASTGSTYFLPTDTDSNGDIICPLGMFRKYILERGHIKDNLVKNGSREGYILDQQTYQRVRRDFLACVDDPRIGVAVKNFALHAFPYDSNGSFVASIILDIYYSE